MKAKEFIIEYNEIDDLDEGWKDWVAGAALGAAALGGGTAAYDAYKDKPVEKPAAAAQYKKEVEPVLKKANAPTNQTKSANAPAKSADAPAKLADAPTKSVTGTVHEELLTKVALSAGIKGTELAQFLAQTAHETGNFKFMKELGNDKTFNKYDIKFNPAKAKSLGNTKVGDGEKYKGRGYLQITGKYNYQKAGEALGLDLVKNPELLEKPGVAARAAVWYWQSRVQPNVTDFENTKEVTKPINSGLKHLDQREEKFKDFKVAMA